MKTDLFSTLQLAELTLQNRIVVSPMCQYSAEDGVAGDWHIMHIGQFAVANPGLIMLEGTAVLPEGRISLTDLCLYNDAQQRGIERLVDFVKTHSDSKLGMQLFHSGRKGSQYCPWDHGSEYGQGDTIDVVDGGWELSGPSAIAYSDEYPMPLCLDVGGLGKIKQAFVDSAERANRAGIDSVELHYAHGYLLHTFLSAVSNQRQDEYGGSLENRMRFPLEVFSAVREVWPTNKPLGARISGSDFGIDANAWDLKQATTFARALASLGCDYVDVSGGFLSPRQNFAEVYGPGYQVDLAAHIKQATSLPTIAVGAISSPHQANEIVKSGQADAIAIARGMLYDPRWPWRAAYTLNAKANYPAQYERAFALGYPDMFATQEMGSE